MRAFLFDVKTVSLVLINFSRACIVKISPRCIGNSAARTQRRFVFRKAKKIIPYHDEPQLDAVGLSWTQFLVDLGGERLGHN